MPNPVPEPRHDHEMHNYIYAPSAEYGKQIADDAARAAEILRERDELRAEVERLRAILGGMADLPTWAEEMGELQAENERLRAFRDSIFEAYGGNYEPDGRLADLGRIIEAEFARPKPRYD